MAEPFLLTVWTPGEALLEAKGVIEMRTLLADGSMGVFPGHAPLLAETAAGPLVYVDGQGEHRVDLEMGILQIERRQVAIFTSGFAGETIFGEDEAQRRARERFDRLTWELMDTLTATPGSMGVYGGAVEQPVDPDVWGESDGG